jgi:hypothetical protein
MPPLALDIGWGIFPVVAAAPVLLAAGELPEALGLPAPVVLLAAAAEPLEVGVVAGLSSSEPPHATRAELTKNGIKCRTLIMSYSKGSPASVASKQPPSCKTTEQTQADRLRSAAQFL